MDSGGAAYAWEGTPWVQLQTSRGLVRFLYMQERSCVYDRLLECEELAKQAKRGLHSNKEPPVNRINDVSAPNSLAR